jgi:DNA polymerase V
VYIMDTQAWNTAIPDILCRNIWGIGRQTTKMLTDSGISSVKELLAQDYSFFKNTFGVVGDRLYLELTGVPAYRVGEHENDEHTSLSSTRSFKDVVHKRSVLESALGYHTAHVCEKLREHNWAASQLTILAAPSRFGDYAYQKNSVSVKLTEPTSDTSALLKVALKCLDSIYDTRVPYKKAGIVVSGIVPECFISDSLFSDGESNREKLDEITDTLNHRFGNGSVRPGVVLMTEKWQVSQKLKSREYTTQWKDIPSVKAI